jgi:PIN domain nuclease of toxin-antitoxin system
VRLLLDTHAVLWWFMDDPRLSFPAGRAIDDPNNDLFLSAVAIYEIGYKQGLRRLPQAPDDLLRRIQQGTIQPLAISLRHAQAAAALPGPHRDPWDRIMMAQAQTEALTVVTVDRVFTQYGVPVLW